MWISVEEQLPEDWDEVLAAFHYAGTSQRFVMIGKFRQEGDEKRFEFAGGDWDADFKAPDFCRKGMGYCEHDSDPDVYVTHWQPLPAPPISERSAGK